MPEYQDQTGRIVTLEKAPQRVVSLVPSISELIWDLGVRPVGRTKFCIHPDEMREVEVVGGTKNIKEDLIIKIEPDLVLANKEENTKKVVESLCKFVPVWVSDISKLDDCLKMIADLGKIMERNDQAEALVSKIREGFDRLEAEIEGKDEIIALYLIWKKPYMAAGTDSFISDVMKKTGLTNCLTARGVKGERYPQLSVDDIKALNPDVILMSSEPYPFKEKDVEELESLVNKKAVLVDGESFSWYGSRMLKSMDYLTRFSRKIRLPSPSR